MLIYVFAVILSPEFDYSPIPLTGFYIVYWLIQDSGEEIRVI